MMIAAATDSSMVIDASVSAGFSIFYFKVGESLIIDFSENNGGMYLYDHIGGAFGSSTNMVYSTGLVFNFKNPEDYSGGFVDYNFGASYGFDYCHGIKKDPTEITSAASLTFGLVSSAGGGVGYDYYSAPHILARW